VPLADTPAQPAPAHHAPAHHQSKARWDRLEIGVLRSVNRVRARRGLPRLRLSRRISFIAGIHAADMARHRFLGHSSSNGTPFSVRIRLVMDARTVGETLAAMRGATTGRRVVRAWMRSPGHRAQVLNPRYRRIGVGRATASGLVFVTADFASRY
jgi:uncharacterized protein YkwD